MRSVDSFPKIGKLERNHLISGDKGAQSVPNRSNPFQPFPNWKELTTSANTFYSQIFIK